MPNEEYNSNSSITGVKELEEEIGVNPDEIVRLAYGYLHQGGGALKPGELEVLNSLPVELRIQFLNIGLQYDFEQQQNAGQNYQPLAKLTAPAWLPQFVPWIKEGQELKQYGTAQTASKYNIPTPSAQTWLRTPLSVQQGFQGYADWYGGTPYQDIMNQMSLMLPKGISSTRRWTPPSQ
jgi:hypothetical protein